MKQQQTPAHTNKCETFQEYLKRHPYKLTGSFTEDDWNASMYEHWKEENEEPVKGYTPGDWWINYISPWSMVQSGDKVLIYFRYGETIEDEECKANARLIAHAPLLAKENEQLKEALSNLITELSPNFNFDPSRYPKTMKTGYDLLQKK